MTALPSRVRVYRRFGLLSGSTIRSDFQLQTSTDGHTLYSNVFFVGSDGRLLGVLEGLEANYSKALNRLVGVQTIADGKL
jgi:hypothetical protein